VGACFEGLDTDGIAVTVGGLVYGVVLNGEFGDNWYAICRKIYFFLLIHFLLKNNKYLGMKKVLGLLSTLTDLLRRY
jgi:hypothetical protein